MTVCDRGIKNHAKDSVYILYGRAPRSRLGGLEECRNLQLPHRVLGRSLSHQHPIFITLRPNSVHCSSVLYLNFNRGLVRSARGRNSLGV